jgi:hypothetical protein
MWSKIISSVSFLIQAILVIAAVLLFSFFDPFNIFGSKKKTLKDTPVSVTSIREIGELITAEYYGEVLGSLKEINVEQLDSNINVLNDLNHRFADAMADMREKNLEFKGGIFTNRKRKIENYFDENYADLRNDPYFSSLMDYLEASLHLNNERQVFKYFYDNDKLTGGDISTAILKDLPKNTRQLFIADKQLLKQQIVMLGRGSVKAGYKFDNFNENNFKYITSSNIIYFIGLTPEILSCNINPWFIPEKKVKGFEIILYTGKASDPKYVAEVKDKCVEELRESAMKQEILVKAESNARENLKSFFSLLLGNPVNDVVFLNSKMQVYLYELKLDGKIINSELSVIDSIITNSTNKDSLYDFMDSVRAMPFEFNNKRDSLTCYSSLVNSITDDGVVDSVEYANLKSLSNNINKPYSAFEKYFIPKKDSANSAKIDSTRKWAFNWSLNIIIENSFKLSVSPNAKLVYSKELKNESGIKEELEKLVVK